MVVIDETDRPMPTGQHVDDEDVEAHIDRGEPDSPFE